MMNSDIRFVDKFDNAIRPASFSGLALDSLSDIQALVKNKEPIISRKVLPKSSQSFLQQRAAWSSVHHSMSKCIELSKSIQGASWKFLRLELESQARNSIIGSCAEEKNLISDVLKLPRIMKAVQATDVESVTFAAALLLKIFRDLQMNSDISSLKATKDFFHRVIRSTTKILCDVREFVDQSSLKVLPGNKGNIIANYVSYVQVIFALSSRLPYALVNTGDSWLKEVTLQTDSYSTPTSLLHNLVTYKEDCEVLLCSCSKCIRLMRFIPLMFHGESVYWFGGSMLLPVSSVPLKWLLKGLEKSTNSKVDTAKINVLKYLMDTRFSSIIGLDVKCTPHGIINYLNLVITSLQNTYSAVDALMDDDSSSSSPDMRQAIYDNIQGAMSDGAEKIAECVFINVKNLLENSPSLEVFMKSDPKRKTYKDVVAWRDFYSKRHPSVLLTLLRELFNTLRLLDNAALRKMQHTIVQYISAVAKSHLVDNLPTIMDEYERFNMTSVDVTLDLKVKYEGSGSCAELIRSPSLLRTYQAIRDICALYEVWKINDDELKKQLKESILIFISRISSFVMSSATRQDLFLCGSESVKRMNEATVVKMGLLGLLSDSLLSIEGTHSKRLKGWANGTVPRLTCILLPFVNEVLQIFDSNWDDLRVVFRGVEDDGKLAVHPKIIAIQYYQLADEDIIRDFDVKILVVDSEDEPSLNVDQLTTAEVAGTYVSHENIRGDVKAIQ